MPVRPAFDVVVNDDGSRIMYRALSGDFASNNGATSMTENMG